MDGVYRREHIHQHVGNRDFLLCVSPLIDLRRLLAHRLLQTPRSCSENTMMPVCMMSFMFRALKVTGRDTHHVRRLATVNPNKYICRKPYRRKGQQPAKTFDAP